MESKVKITITNKLTGYSCGGIFDSLENANDYIDRQKAKSKHPIGKAKHEVIVDEKVAPNERAIYKEDRSLTSLHETEGFHPVIDEDDGSILYYEKIHHVYTIPCEYEVTVEEYIDSNKNRNDRDRILSKTDWLFVADTPVPTIYRGYYKNYRQMLRDLDLESVAQVEDFEQWLMRTNSQEFMDGGEAEAIIKKFKYYL